MSAMAPVTRTGTLPSDRLRQGAVTVAEVLCVLGTLAGVGVIGTRVAESSGGALAADATLLAPAGPAFAIWTPIYLGLAGFTVWQWLPTQTTEPRHRAIGWLAAASMVLNAAWLLVTQQGWLWASVVVMAGLVATLGLLVRRLEEHPSYGHGETVLVDGTFGLYLGWVAVAACANVTAALVASGVDPGGYAAQLARSSCSPWPPAWVGSSPSGSGAAGPWRSPWRGACSGSPGDGSAASRGRWSSPSPPSSLPASSWLPPRASTPASPTDPPGPRPSRPPPVRRPLLAGSAPRVERRIRASRNARRRSSRAGWTMASEPTFP